MVGTLNRFEAKLERLPIRIFLQLSILVFSLSLVVGIVMYTSLRVYEIRTLEALANELNDQEKERMDTRLERYRLTKYVRATE